VDINLVKNQIAKHQVKNASTIYYILAGINSINKIAPMVWAVSYSLAQLTHCPKLNCP
jgi:hypothetical protein